MLEARQHVYDVWQTFALSTCEQPGARKRNCKYCGQAEQEELPMRKHIASRWQVSIQAKLFTPGEQQKLCRHCGLVMQTRAYYPGDKAFAVSFCLPGLRFRDIYSDTTREWYRFYLVDTRQDAEHSLPLVAADAHQVGQVVLKVVGGKLSVCYELFDARSKVLKERLHLLKPSEELTAEFILSDRKGMKLSGAEDIYHSTGDGDLVLVYLRLSGVYDPGRAGNVRLNWQSESLESILNEQTTLLTVWNK